MSSLQVGRLALGPPWQWHEQVGDPVTNLGGAAIPAPRQALRHLINISTLAPDGAPDTLSDRLRIRRQLRSMLNNTPLKLQGYLYVIYSDDPDQNGWYVPDFGSLADIDGAVGLASGVWKLEQVAWIMAGHRRTNREARNIWMKDLRTGLAWRDSLKMIYSTDFAALPGLQLTTLPHGATSITNAVSGQVPTATALPAGRDGGVCQIVSGQADLACLSYDRPDAAWGLSDVIVYDRRGQITAPATGPDTLWEEAYGPDHQWSWIAATPGVPDAPVLDNGLVRVRFDTTVPGFYGFRIDAWTGSAYVEQGKVSFIRGSPTPGTLGIWVSSSLVEYTPDRAVMCVVLATAAATDPQSRERIFITMQRGEFGVVIDGYPAPRANGTPVDMIFMWATALNAGVADVNGSAALIVSSGTGNWVPGVPPAGQIVATAGTGAGTGHSGPYGGGNFMQVLGPGSFVGCENWLAILRCPTAFATIGAFQQTLVYNAAANVLAEGGSETTSYAIQSNEYRVQSQNSAGYVQGGIFFSATQADQIMEAEAMTLGTNTVTAVDALASGTGSNTTTSTRTTDANPHVTRATWPNGFLATYRVFARVKTTASTLNIYAKTGATTGPTQTTVATVYVWLDLGEVVANNTTLEIHCWATAAATVSVDRIEAVLVQDRTRGNAIFSGSRDLGQAALFDSRVLGALVAR